MTLPKRTTVLIVGAGPTGLTAAIALSKAGVKDYLIVDALKEGENSSRAMTVHAATLDSLDALGCAEPLVQLGIQGKALQMNDRNNPSAPLVSIDFTTLKGSTKFPYVLILPQNITERVLKEQLETQHGVQVQRPFKVTNIANGDTLEGQTKVTFESGEVVYASYVIGADGAKSTIRQMADIGYADPDGQSVEETVSQMIFADIVFDQKLPIPSDRLNAFGSANAFFGIIPMQPHFIHPETTPENLEEAKAAIARGEIVYRIGCHVPASDGVPPSQPPKEYLQTLVDKYGPLWLNSDNTVNPSGNSVHISQVAWSTRFRNHAAIASKFFTRLALPADVKETHTDKRVKPKGGIVLLVGDAAHIHSPAGGLGMNLGIRDAAGLGPVIAEHIKATEKKPLFDEDRVLRTYTEERYARATQTIHLTKKLLFVLSRVQGSRFVAVRNAIIRFVTGLPFVKRKIAMRVSGIAIR